MYDKNYDALSKIAPTLHIPYGTASDIYETLTLFGDIVGQPEKAEQFIAEYEKKAAKGREKLKGVIDETATFGLYELTDKGELWMFGDNAGRGGQAIYNALKLKMPEKDGEHWRTSVSAFHGSASRVCRGLHVSDRVRSGKQGRSVETTAKLSHLA